MAERARWRCEYCLSPAAYSTQPFEIDHIIPRSKNGGTTPENLAFSCGCNSYKSDKTRARDPQTGRTVSLFHPRRQRWLQHFAWSTDALRILRTHGDWQSHGRNVTTIPPGIDQPSAHSPGGWRASALKRVTRLCHRVFACSVVITSCHDTRTNAEKRGGMS